MKMLNVVRNAIYTAALFAASSVFADGMIPGLTVSVSTTKIEVVRVSEITPFGVVTIAHACTNAANSKTAWKRAPGHYTHSHIRWAERSFTAQGK